MPSEVQRLFNCSFWTLFHKRFPFSLSREFLAVLFLCLQTDLPWRKTKDNLKDQQTFDKIFGSTQLNRSLVNKNVGKKCWKRTKIKLKDTGGKLRVASEWSPSDNRWISQKIQPHQQLHKNSRNERFLVSPSKSSKHHYQSRPPHPGDVIRNSWHFPVERQMASVTFLLKFFPWVLSGWNWQGFQDWLHRWRRQCCLFWTSSDPLSSASRAAVGCSRCSPTTVASCRHRQVSWTYASGAIWIFWRCSEKVVILTRSCCCCCCWWLLDVVVVGRWVETKRRYRWRCCEQTTYVLNFSVEISCGLFSLAVEWPLMLLCQSNFNSINFFSCEILKLILKDYNNYYDNNNNNNMIIIVFNVYLIKT